MFRVSRFVNEILHPTPPSAPREPLSPRRDPPGLEHDDVGVFLGEQPRPQDRRRDARRLPRPRLRHEHQRAGLLEAQGDFGEERIDRERDHPQER